VVVPLVRKPAAVAVLVDNMPEVRWQLSQVTTMRWLLVSVGVAQLGTVQLAGTQLLMDLQLLLKVGMEAILQILIIVEVVAVRVVLQGR
jgi:predicted anti-sigma-YlaC factor YlaD